MTDRHSLLFTQPLRRQRADVAETIFSQPASQSVLYSSQYVLCSQRTVCVLQQTVHSTDTDRHSKHSPSSEHYLLSLPSSPLPHSPSPPSPPINSPGTAPSPPSPPPRLPPLPGIPGTPDRLWVRGTHAAQIIHRVSGCCCPSPNRASARHAIFHMRPRPSEAL